MNPSYQSLDAKIFESADKVQCVNTENILSEFFSSPLYVREFLGGDGLEQEFFSYAYALAGIFFSKITRNFPKFKRVFSQKLAMILRLSKFVNNRE